MKDSQWAVAVGALAVLVFVVVFAGQYLGGPADRGGGGPDGSGKGGVKRAVKFGFQDAPDGFSEDKQPVGPGPTEVERDGRGHADYYFLNDNAQAVAVGLRGANCKCTDAHLLLLPGDGAAWPSWMAAEMLGHGSHGGLAALGAYRLSLARFEAVAKSHELKRDGDPATVPSKAVGWVRLGWHAEKPGAQAIEARVWMDDRVGGMEATLTGRAFTQDPIRHRPMMSVGIIQEAEMSREGGAVRDLIVWSSTRPTFRVLVTRPGGRGKGDPLEVGTPVPLTDEEVHTLEHANNAGAGTPDAMPGMVVSGWKVPLKFRSVSADGKTPFEIGPFRRSVMVSSPDVIGSEPREVTVVGRVRGVVELGNDDEGGELTFRTFRGRSGRTEGLNLTSDVKDMDLKVDPSRTAKFLEVKVAEPKQVGDSPRRVWRLTVTVKAGAVSGMFPRKDDPVYEDTAIYLIGTAPGQPPRTVRVAVSGSAVEG